MDLPKHSDAFSISEKRGVGACKTNIWEGNRAGHKHI